VSVSLPVDSVMTWISVISGYDGQQNVANEELGQAVFEAPHRAPEAWQDEGNNEAQDVSFVVQWTWD